MLLQPTGNNRVMRERVLGADDCCGLKERQTDVYRCARIARLNVKLPAHVSYSFTHPGHAYARKSST